MKEISSVRANYWAKQVQDFISIGKPYPDRFCKALERQTFISKIINPKGLYQYVPDRSTDAINTLNEMYSNYPQQLAIILSVKEPINIKTPLARKQKTATKKASTPVKKIKIKYRAPKYTKYIQKTIEYGKPILLVGPAGSGKTKLFYEIAKKTKKQIYRVNFDGGMTPDAFLGGVRLRTIKDEDGISIQGTYFQEGPVIKAAKEGAWLLLDEIDKVQPEYAAAMHAMIENIRNPIILNDDGGRSIIPHSEFRIMATANTLGSIEDNSLGYYGSSPMNAAFLDRFSILQVSYPPDEISIVNDILDNTTLSEKLVQVAKLTRQAMSEGQLNGTPFSTRRLIAWASTFKYLGDFDYATELEILGRYTEAACSLVESFLTNVFGNNWRSFTEISDTLKTALHTPEAA